MKKNDKSVRGNIEDFLCPFTDMCITQGSNNGFSHKGIMANDVIGKESGVRYPYYAPCKCECKKVYPNSGQSMWQSLNKVRFANGRIDYATFMIAHDDSQDCYVGQIIEQGQQIGNMGMKGNATGVHCHIQISQSNDTSWYKNQYDVYQFNNEYDTDDCYFVDNTNIIDGNGGHWKYTSDIEVNEDDLPCLYITNYNMYVRTGAGTNYSVKLVEQLTEDGKKNATSTNLKDLAIYKKGTIFTCYERFYKQDGSIWAITPSGYVCIKGASGTEYCSITE